MDLKALAHNVLFQAFAVDTLQVSLHTSRKRRKLSIYTDGAARGNPGPSASGYMIFDNGKLVRKDAFYNGKATNNIAEYKAIIAALEWCESHNGRDASITLSSDSELAVKQLNGVYKTKSAAMKTLHRKAARLARVLGDVKFENLRRSSKYISAVDRSLNALLDEMDDNTARKDSKTSK